MCRYGIKVKLYYVEKQIRSQKSTFCAWCQDTFYLIFALKNKRLNHITIMRTLCILVLALVFSVTSQAQNLPQLKVSDNGHYLQTADGKPFFYQGDTAWELFHRPNREEVDIYIKNRADKGYNVIQAVALSEVDGVNVDNAYGDGTFIHAWLPSIFSAAELQIVRGGEVLHITEFNAENEAAVKALTMKILLDTKAYKTTK